jgi:hypothetical protein
MVHKYALVNPIVVGSLDTIVEADNSALAAKEIYNKLSPYFSNAQSSLVFTIQKLGSKGKEQLGGSNGSYYDFKVKEVEKADGEVVFTISTYSGKVDHKRLGRSISNVLSKLDRKKNLAASDSESDSESEYKPKPKNGLKGGAKNKDDESETFNKLLEELDDEESEILPKRRNNNYTSNLIVPNVYPYYFPTFFTPALLDPISYYWYSDIYLDTPRLYFPSFVSSIRPRLILDRYVDIVVDPAPKTSVTLRLP